MVWWNCDLGRRSLVTTLVVDFPLLAAFSRPAHCKCSPTRQTQPPTPREDNAMGGGEENTCDASSAMVFIV